MTNDHEPSFLITFLARVFVAALAVYGAWQFLPAGNTRDTVFGAALLYYAVRVLKDPADPADRR